MIRHLLNFLLWILPPSRLFWFRKLLLTCGGIRVGERVSICGRGWVYGRGVLCFGDRTWASPGVIFYTHPDAPISVGHDCDIGPGVEFIPGSHDIGSRLRRAGSGWARPITVGNGCWIGAKSIILGGVHLGDGCIVAAGSVVTKDVLSNSMVAGVPARTKRQLP